MFIVCKRNVLFRNADGRSAFLPKGFMGEAPDWIGGLTMYRNMVKDGLIVVSESHSDKSIEGKLKVAETAEKRARTRSRAKALE